MIQYSRPTTARPPQRRPIGSSLVAIATLLCCIVSACASGPDTGVRTDYEQTKVSSIAIVPFYARGTFGMEPERFQELQKVYENVAAQALREQGFEVMDAKTFENHLVEQGLWSEFGDGINLRQSLTSYFEPLPAASSHPIEIRTLRSLAAQEAFPVDTLLFGQVLYHSEGTCRHDAQEFTPYARISIAPSAPSNFPRPCVTSHFQAKLVDAKTGNTMWFNRMFVETHSRQLDDEIRSNNIAQTVITTLTEDGSIAPLAPGNIGADAQAGSP